MRWFDHSVSHLYGVLTVLLSILQPACMLNCYECTDTFKGIWVPLACQENVTIVPTRVCNSEQQYCFVESVSVKGILIKITRNCVDECFYGCKVTGFGITSLTCTSCCDSDLCNTGNHGVPYKLKWMDPCCMVFCMAVLTVMKLVSI